MATPPKHIAIIDDNRMKRLFLAGLLEDAFSIHSYGSGEEALKEIPHLDLQCILLDIDMPGEDGFQVIRRIKNIPAISDVPVIFVTSLSDQAIERRGLESGAVDFVGNQVAPEIIRARVLHHVDLYGYRCRLGEGARKYQDHLRVAGRHHGGPVRPGGMPG